MNSKNTVKVLIKKIFVSSLPFLMFFVFTNSVEAFNPLAYVKNIYNSYIDNLSYFFTPFTQVAAPILSSAPEKTTTTTTIVTKTISTPAPIVKVASPIISEATFISALEKVLNRKDIQDQLRGPQGPAGISGTSSRFVGQGAFESPHVFFSITNADITKLNVTGNSTLANLTVSGALTAQSITGTVDPNLTLGSILFQGATGMAEDNTNLFWDDTNDRLGVGTSAPGVDFDIAKSADTIFRVRANPGSARDAVLRLDRSQQANARSVIQLQTAEVTDWYIGTFNYGNTDSSGYDLHLSSTGQGDTDPQFTFTKTGKFGIGTINPTAYLHLKAGTTAVSTAPLKFTSGPLQTTAEVGAVEFLNDAYYGTITTGAARKTFAFLESPTFITQITAPVIIGGTATTSTLTLKPTSGVGTTGADIIFKTGNNGATESLRILNSGYIGVGTSAPSEKLTLTGGNFLHSMSGEEYLNVKGTYNTAGNALKVYVSGKYAYVADEGPGLQIIDISNPASPALVGTYNTAGNAKDIYVSGKYAYIADDISGLQIIDISNPTSPALTGTYNTSGNAYGVYVSGKYAYVADYSDGLQIIDISNPTSPTLTGTYNTSGNAYGVYVSGKYAYVADRDSGLQIIDISNPTSPALIGTYNTIGSAYKVYVSGKYAYVADGIRLQIINISNPASPTLTGFNSDGDIKQDVYVSGKYAYVADLSNGLQVFDVSNPTAPIWTGIANDYNPSYGVYVSGKYAYVAEHNAGLAVIDINGIETPSLYAGNIQTNDITVTENSDIGNNLLVRNALNVGQGGILSDGKLSISDTSYFGNNLGIKTTNPGQQLTIAGDSTQTLKAGYFSTDNVLISQLEGGPYFGRVGVKENQFGLSNYGNTWIAKDSARAWFGIAMSSDGKIQTATVFGGQIYVSTDYGNTWVAKNSVRNWFGIAMSSDGKIQTATVFGGQIYVSTDYGNTWVAKNSNRSWSGVSMSSDGKIQTATVWVGGQIYVSNDYGNTWTAKDSNRAWRLVAMSSDGKFQTTADNGGQIYVSTDYGNTWTAKDSNRLWHGVSMSSDGKIQTAVAADGQIYVSTDYGNNWTAKDSIRTWVGVAMSSDGKIQTATVIGGQLYVSTDYGNTWTAKDSSRTWYAVAMSSDGKIITATDKAPGYIYVSHADSFISGGNVGIGNTDPGYMLHVGSASVTDATVLLRLEDADSVCDFTANAGAPTCGSDETLKKNINDQKDNLAKILALRPVTYNWLTDQDGVEAKHGFIAQEVAKVMPELVTNGTWLDGTTRKFLQTTGMTPYIIGAIQELNANMESLTLPVTEENKTQTFAERFFGKMVVWLGEAGNGIGDLFSNRVKTKELCVGEVCVSESQFLQMVNSANIVSVPTPAPDPTPTPAPAPDPAPTTSPDDPALVPVTDPVVTPVLDPVPQPVADPAPTPTPDPVPVPVSDPASTPTS